MDVYHRLAVFDSEPSDGGAGSVTVTLPEPDPVPAPETHVTIINTVADPATPPPAAPVESLELDDIRTRLSACESELARLAGIIAASATREEAPETTPAPPAEPEHIPDSEPTPTHPWFRKLGNN